MPDITTMFNSMQISLRALLSIQPALKDFSTAVPIPSTIEEAFERVNAGTINDFERLNGYVAAIAQLHKMRILYQKSCIADLKGIITELQKLTKMGWDTAFDRIVVFIMPRYTECLLEAFDVLDIKDTVVVRALQYTFERIEGTAVPILGLPSGTLNQMHDLFQQIKNSEGITNPVDGLNRLIAVLEQACDAKDQAYVNLVLHTLTHIAELQVAKSACWANQASYDAAKAVVLNDFGQLHLTAQVDTRRMRACLSAALDAFRVQTKKMQTAFDRKLSEVATKPRVNQ